MVQPLIRKYEKPAGVFYYFLGFIKLGKEIDVSGVGRFEYTVDKLWDTRDCF